MENSQIIGLGISTLVLFLAMIKAEALKNLVAKVFSVKGQQQTAISLVLLIIAVVVPACLGWALTESPSKRPEPDPLPIETKKEKTGNNPGDLANAITDNVIKTVGVGVEVYDEVEKNNQEKQAAFESARQHRWVYAIGSEIHKSNDGALEEIYNSIPDKTNLCLYKDGRSFRFIKMEAHTKEELEASLDNARQMMKQQIEIMDAMKDCTYTKPWIRVTGKQKIGKRKNKVFVDYYEPVK